MHRMFGMMPLSEIEKTTQWDDGNGLHCSIDAGPNGWTLHFADHSNKYRDISNGTDANHAEALEILMGHFPKAFEIKRPVMRECMCEAIGEEMCDE